MYSILLAADAFCILSVSLTSVCHQESGNSGSGRELYSSTATLPGRFFALFSEKSPGLPPTAAWSSAHLTGTHACLIDAIRLFVRYLFVLVCNACDIFPLSCICVVLDRKGVWSTSCISLSSSLSCSKISELRLPCPFRKSADGNNHSTINVLLCFSDTWKMIAGK